jgi:S1-C subfamily serine protease
MPDSTLLTDAGLRAGDVLTEVNGVPIDSLATLIGLWPRLQTESAVNAVVLRNGHPVSLSVTLR